MTLSGYLIEEGHTTVLCNESSHHFLLQLKIGFSALRLSLEGTRTGDYITTQVLRLPLMSRTRSESSCDKGGGGSMAVSLLRCTLCLTGSACFAEQRMVVQDDSFFASSLRGMC
jgi:hypothetical protein